MFNFPWGPLPEQVDDRGPFAEQALQVDKKTIVIHKCQKWRHGKEIQSKNGRNI